MTINDDSWDQEQEQVLKTIKLFTEQDDTVEHLESQRVETKFFDVDAVDARVQDSSEKVQDASDNEFDIINEVQDKSPAWGLNRISHRTLTKNDTSYSYPNSAGTDIDVYIIDTGIFTAHPEFEHRAVLGKSFTKDGIKDGNGHGTHVAGTIGSMTYGVAKNCSLIAVKVLDASGAGSTSSVIAGIEWAAKEVKRKTAKGKKVKSVANMSLGGGASTALDRAVKGMIFMLKALTFDNNRNVIFLNYSNSRSYCCRYRICRCRR